MRCPLPDSAAAAGGFSRFLEELKAAGWEADAIRAVELAVVKMLARLMGGGEESNGSSS